LPRAHTSTLLLTRPLFATQALAQQRAFCIRFSDNARRLTPLFARQAADVPDPQGWVYGKVRIFYAYLSMLLPFQHQVTDDVFVFQPEQVNQYNTLCFQGYVFV
jgi:hypothetical protein